MMFVDDCRIFFHVFLVFVNFMNDAVEIFAFLLKGFMNSSGGHVYFSCVIGCMNNVLVILHFSFVILLNEFLVDIMARKINATHGSPMERSRLMEL